MGRAVVAGDGSEVPVPASAVQIECQVKLVSGILGAADQSVGAGEVAVGEGLRGRVAQPLGRGEGMTLNGDPVVPVALPVEVGAERPGQLPGRGR